MRRGCAVAVGLLLALAGPARAAAPAGPITGSLTKAGIWTVDDQGRVVVLHGFDILRKVAPFYPDNFTEKDARFLADEGFNAARIGWIWSGAEPQPGQVDDAYIAKLAGFERLLGRYGIRTMVDSHQDTWSYNGTQGDGAPDWATLGSSTDEDFMHFWDDDKAPDGVGIQTHFINVWKHVAAALASSPNVLGYDPFNEPYPGSKYPSPCADFAPCPEWEKTQLAAFYRRAIDAIRGASARQLIEVETSAYNGTVEPQLPAFDDPQSGFTFHYYCTGPGPLPFFLLQMFGGADAFDDAMDASGCPDQEPRALDVYRSYLKKLNVPTFMGEFSAADTNRDNTRMVDLMDERFLSWTVWHYYSKPEPGGSFNEGILVDDSKPGSEDNAKQAKLDALVVPWVQAIAGTPLSYAFDRATNTMTASWSTHPAGAALAPGARTQIFVPERKYADGYTLTVTGGKVVSPEGAAFAEVLADPGAETVSVKLTPRTGSFTQRPLETGAFPIQEATTAPPPRACGSRRSVLIHIRGLRHARARSVRVYVNGARQKVSRAGLRAVRVSLRGRSAGTVRVEIVARTNRGHTVIDRRTYHPCTHR